MEFRTALRNVFRNRRRTAFSLAVIVVGTAIFLIALAFIGEALRSSRVAIACETGAVQVAHERLFDGTSEGYEDLIAPEVAARALELIATRRGVTGTARQLDFAGLVGDERGSTLIIGRGVTTCSCVKDVECYRIEGSPLPVDASRQVLLGRSLAEKLSVGIGGRVNVATGTASGNFNAATVTIVGTLTVALETLEGQLGLFPLEFVQRLLKTDGVARILIGLEDLDDAELFAKDLAAALAAEGLPLVTRTWKELSPSFSSLETFYTAFSGLAGIAVFALVFFSVIEILTISFLERTREVGTVRAFGATRWRVFRGFVLEGILIGVLGATLGAVGGLLLATGFNAIGFAWTPPGSAVPQPIQLNLTPSTALTPLLTVVLATLASAILPAWKNARLRVVQALQSV
ncbi:MAG: FtsX-like permease family protein [Candidatus Bipolaricaulota bacterium]